MAARHLTEQPVPPSDRNPRVGAGLEAVVLTALAKDPADRYQSAAAMAQDLDRIVTDAGSAPLNAARGGSPTDRLPDSIPTGAATVPMAPAARRRPGWVSWALVAARGIIALVAVALWPRDGDPQAAQQPIRPTASTAAPPSTPAHTSPATQSQAALPAALANLARVITIGQQQGSVDTSATDLLKQAEEVLRAADESKAKDVDKKLQELQRKTDEQIDKGKIRGPAVGQVRQAVAQFSQAVRSR